MDAQIRTDQGHEEWTKWHGRFDLDDVYGDIPIRLGIRAFGYLPLDTTFVPDDDERYEFELVPDPLAERMIEVQAQRLEERAGDLLYENRPPLMRDDMARYTGSGTLRTMLEMKYPSILRRVGVGCFIFDEQPIRTRDERIWALEHTLPEELERVEILEFPGPARRFMLRVYSRAFFQELITRSPSLRNPIMQPFTGSCR